MARLSKIFTKQVEVPNWEYCNIHRDEEKDSIKNEHCSFIHKYGTGEYGCRLFNEILYSHEYRVKKCESCIKEVDADVRA